MVKISCKRCTYQWEYKGTRKRWATCPDCKTSCRVAIFKQQEDSKVKHFEALLNDEMDKREKLTGWLIERYPQVMEEYNNMLVAEAREQAQKDIEETFK